MHRERRSTVQQQYGRQGQGLRPETNSSRVEAVNQGAPEVEVHHSGGFGIILWTGSSTKDNPVEKKSCGFLRDPGLDCFTFANNLGEFLLEVVFDRGYPSRKEFILKDELPVSLETKMETAELMWDQQIQQPNRFSMIKAACLGFSHFGVRVLPRSYYTDQSDTWGRSNSCSGRPKSSSWYSDSLQRQQRILHEGQYQTGRGGANL
jgi:hypothetical protein